MQRIVWFVLTPFLLSAFAEAQEQESQLSGYLFKPEEKEFDASRLESLKLPNGFRVRVFAQGIENPRMMVVGPDRTVYVTKRESGEVAALRDTSGDGTADSVRIVAQNLPYVNGIALREGQLYLVTDTRLLRAEIREDGTLSDPEALVENLPDGGQHPNRTIGFGPDGQMYVSIGSSCNACDESNEEHATLLRFSPDGGNRTIFARGLRNTIGFGWHPETRELWGMDHGSDWRGNDQPPEELNRIQQGLHYGWPFCYGDREVDEYLPADPKGSTKEEFCPDTTPPVLTYQAHSSPLAMIFYEADQFPQEYRGDAFVAMRGSWNRKPATGYKVVRIRFENGTPTGIEDFLTGFLSDDGTAQFGRPTGLAIYPDGSLLLSDDTNGVIYQISYEAEAPSPHTE
jgi:glucose/arabinose dehydrogenase